MTTETRTITLPDGRTVTVDLTGPAGGRTVVLLQAAPGSRRFDPDPAATAAAGVRLVTLDRAGYGGSSPLAEGSVPTITGYADDVAAVMDELGIDDAAVVGWSAGGRVAAALAARHPSRTSAIALIATPAPDEDVPWVPDEQRPAIEAMRADPAGGVGVLAGMLGDEPGGVDTMAGGAADAVALEDRARRDPIAAMVEEAYRQGPIGLALDIVSYTAVPWGFDPAAVGAPVTLVYGAADELVPPAHGEWWAMQFAAAHLVVVEGEGHLVVQPAWADVLARITAPASS